MKAIHIASYVKENSDLRVSDIPAPQPAAHEVVVDIAYTALNHVDLLYARGTHQNNHIGLVKPPFVLGLEFSGTVARAGSASGFAPGDRVWGGGVGGFAEQICVAGKTLQRVPRGWTLRDAAGVGAGTAPVSYGALVRTAGVQAGEWVLVHAAAGGLGVMAVQIARALGAKVIGTVGSEGKEKVVRDMGAEVVRYDVDGWEQAVLKLTGGKGVDVVYDTVGLVEKSIRCSKFGGRIIIAGFAGRGGKMESMTMNRILLKGVKVLGYRYGETGRRIPGENELIWREMNDMLAKGLVKPMIYGVYPGLESVPKALDDLAARKVWGKALVEINPETKASAKL